MSTTNTLDREESTAPAHSPRYSRLTRSDVGVLLKLRQDGLSQVEIAQRLGCTQPTVSKWLADLNDTTDASKAYLRGQALRMAQNIVKKGLPRDHVAALKGLSVLEEERSAGLVIQIGVKDSDVSIALSPPSNAGGERKVAESLTIMAGSDKVR